MDVSPIIPRGKKMITGYGNGGFKINGEFIEGSLIVMPEQIIAWPVTQNAIDFDALLSLIVALENKGHIEILLIGGGKQMQPLSPAIRQRFKAHHIAVDVMDTGAACRTYNVLLGEDRRVAAAIMAI